MRVLGPSIATLIASLAMRGSAVVMPPATAPAPPLTRVCATGSGTPEMFVNRASVVVFAYGEKKGGTTIFMIDVKQLASIFDATYEPASGGLMHVKSATADVAFSTTSLAVTRNGKAEPPLQALPVRSGGVLYVDAGLASWLATDPSDVYSSFFADAPVDADGKPLPIPSVCEVAAKNYGDSIAAAATMPYPERKPPALWCESETAIASANSVSISDAIGVRAERELCSGYYAAAAKDLRTIEPDVIKHGPDGTQLIDFERRYILAQSLGGRADGAEAMLRHNGAPSPELRALWASNYCQSLRTFAADDATLFRTPDEAGEYVKTGPPPNLKRAVDDDCAGNVDAALADLKTIDNAYVSLFGLMIGNLDAQKRDWKGAAAAWWSAANRGNGHAVMEYYDFDDANVEALWNLYYYRAHFKSI